MHHCMCFSPKRLKDFNTNVENDIIMDMQNNRLSPHSDRPQPVCYGGGLQIVTGLNVERMGNSKSRLNRIINCVQCLP